MRLYQNGKAALLSLTLLLGAAGAQSTDPQTKPDNTAVNKRDRNPGEVTADKQKMNADDRALTAGIRRSVQS